MDTVTEVKFRPLDKNFGAEILDLDLASADDATLDAVVDIFHHQGAIVVRGQSMSPTDLMRFGSRFGGLEDVPAVENSLPGFPKVYVLSNRITPTRPVATHKDGFGWHTDSSFLATPVMATMLYAVEVPPEGSDTLLADCCKAWNALPAERKAQLDGKTVHHSWRHFMTAGRPFNRKKEEDLKLTLPDVFHPLVRTHPADGRKSLFLSSTTVKNVEGLEQEDAWALMRDLIAHTTQDEFVFRHKWQVGDILMWDNRCTLHTGTPFDDVNHFREMQRVWIKGEKPY